MPEIHIRRGGAMYLKEIQLENFKSIKGSVKIPFKRGFTAVTGPNGSGKSNISDAILFVLGPKSSKMIRAGNLLELIWNGGKNGKPAEKCRVTLVFDNSEKTIPVGYEEVHLTRVIKRSKDSKQGYVSYFYINGNKSTLGEFEELLAYAGISSDGYNLVQQGDVTRIVNMGGVERRRIIESIAGTTHLDEEMEKARKKRMELDNNLEKISVRMDEIEARLKELDSDRGMALKYRELQEKMELAKAQFAYKKLSAMSSERESIKKSILDFENEREELNRKIENLRNRHREIVEELKKIEEDAVSRWGDEAKKVKEQIDGYRLEIARIDNFMESAEDAIREMHANKEGETKKLKEEEKSLNALKDREKSLSEALQKEREELRKVSEELKSLKDRNSISSKRGKELRKKYSELSESHRSSIKKLSEVREEKVKVEERLRSLREKKASIEEEKKDLEFELKDVRWQLKNLGKGRKYSQKELKSMKQEMFALRVEEREKSVELTKLQSQISRMGERYAVEKAKTDAHGGMGAVSVILEARDRGKIKGIIGTVDELISYEDKYANAIQTAAGNRIKAIVVESDEVAAKAIKYLKDGKLGRATFLPLNRMRAGRPRGRAIITAKKDGVLGFAVDLAEYDERYRAAIWYAFGDTLITKNLDTARKLMGGVRLVTLDGELIEVSGAMIGGTVARMKTGRNKELEELGKKLRERREIADKIGASLTEIRARLEELEALVNEAEKDSEANSKIEALEMKEREYRSKLEELKGELKGISMEISKLEGISAEISKKVDGLENIVKKQEKELKEIEEESNSLMPEETQKKIRQLEETETQLSEKVRELEMELKGIEGEISSLERVSGERKERISSIEKAILRKRKEMEKKKEEKFRLNSELEAVLKLNSGIEKEMRALHEKRELLMSEEAKVKADMERAKTMLETKQDYILGLQTKLESVDDSITEIEEEYKGYGIEVKEPVPSMERLKKTMRECELEMSGIGNVNFRAIEDYDTQTERYNELKEETEKLKEQKKELINMEKELEEKKKEAFLKVFSAVNENFRKIYSELSNGGEGELSLDNPESIFEGGMTITARPRGKKVYRIEALSGGEKSLVALAFVFAIQEYDPSPFYLLDEVDGNLDGLNSELVGERIKRSSGRAQFIAISHRKALLKHADHLIGATMIGDGVTRIIHKVDLSTIKEPEEEEKDYESRAGVEVSA